MLFSGKETGIIYSTSNMYYREIKNESQQRVSYHSAVKKKLFKCASSSQINMRYE